MQRTLQAVEEGKAPRLVDKETLEAVEQAWPLLDSLEQQDKELKDRVLLPVEPPRSRQARQRMQSEQRMPPVLEPIKIQEPKSPVQEARISHLSGDGVKEQQPRRRVLSQRERDYIQFFDQKFGTLVVLILYIALADLEKATF